MGRKYQCTTCGSLQVYHHCVAAVATAVANRPIVRAVLCNPLPPADQRDCNEEAELAPLTPNVAEQKTKHTCYNCHDAPHVVARRGIHDGRVHDRLCQPCYETLIDQLSEYIPAPSKSAPLNKPGGMLIRQWSKRSRLRKEHAITVLYCKGELIQAYALKQRNAEYVKNVI